MIAGLQDLDTALILALSAAVAGILWWTYRQFRVDPAQHTEELRLRKIARQPWDDDKAGGRGNR